MKKKLVLAALLAAVVAVSPCSLTGAKEKKEKVMFTISEVNCRKTPSLQGEILGHYQKGSVVLITGIDENGWAKSQQGYVHASFLTDEEPEYVISETVEDTEKETKKKSKKKKKEESKEAETVVVLDNDGGQAVTPPDAKDWEAADPVVEVFSEEDGQSSDAPAEDVPKQPVEDEPAVEMPVKDEPTAEEQSPDALAEETSEESTEQEPEVDEEIQNLLEVIRKRNAG